MKVGILAAGHIAEKMATTINGMKHPDIEFYAVASRSLERAQAFAQKFGAKVAYGSYEELAKDPQVDLIYIASPHSEHYQHAMLCLKERKAILVEKSFTANTQMAYEVLDYGRKQQTLVAEAIWTRYMPSRALVMEAIRADKIGKVHSIQANLGYNIDEVKRIVEPELAGGALLDLGVYPINFAMMFFGNDIKEINGSCVKNAKGVDMIDNISLTFSQTKMATLHANAFCNTDRSGLIFGDAGYIKVTNINNPEKIEIFNPNHELVETIAIPEQVTGFEYQVLACYNALKHGLIECPEMPHQEILNVMSVMDKLRAQWGITYPFEKELVIDPQFTLLKE